MNPLVLALAILGGINLASWSFIALLVLASRRPESPAPEVEAPAEPKLRVVK